MVAVHFGFGVSAEQWHQSFAGLELHGLILKMPDTIALLVRFFRAATDEQRNQSNDCSNGFAERHMRPPFRCKMTRACLALDGLMLLIIGAS